MLVGVLMVVARPLEVTPAPVPGDRLVVIGVGERGTPSPVDSRLLDDPELTVAYGMVATNRHIGECVSAAWLSLGSGRKAQTGEECDLRIVLAPAARLGQEGAASVSNWGRLQELNASYGVVDLGHYDARLADAVDPDSDRCITAVGPGAALAAADRHGRVERYTDLSGWQARGYPTDCRVTLVDATTTSEALIRQLVEEQGATVVVLGLGTAGPLEHDALGVAPADKVSLSSVQLAYRVDPAGTGIAGALSSQTTRESGMVTLPDISAMAVEVLRADRGEAPRGELPAAPLGVVPGPVSSAHAIDLVQTVDVLQHRRPVLLVFGAGMVGLLISAGLMVTRRRWGPAPLVGAALTTWPIALLSAGMWPWYATGLPVLAGVGHVLAAWVLATLVARALTTERRPAGIAGASLSLALTAASAALGDAWQWGTLLDQTTALGPDWVGIGPGAAAICVGSALTIAAWWADRLPKRESVVAIVALVVVVGIALLPNVSFVIALLCGGVVLTFADTARSWVREAVPWADPLFVGNAVATLVAALVGTALLLVDSGTILLHMAPETPLFGGIIMGWLGSVTLALWLQMRAGTWFAVHDSGLVTPQT